MEQNQFRIGATYRNKRGDVVRLSELRFSPHAQHWECKHPGHTFAQADRVGDGLGCGYISFRNGEHCANLGEDSEFHLIPGELTLVNGEWVGFDFKREEEDAKNKAMRDFLEALDSVPGKVIKVRKPTRYTFIAPVIAPDPNAAMIARDGPARPVVAKPAPAVVSNVHPCPSGFAWRADTAASHLLGGGVKS